LVGLEEGGGQGIDGDFQKMLKQFNQVKYQRDEKKMKWVTDTWGAFDPANPMTATGYDACAAARHWLERNGRSEMSIMEAFQDFGKQKLGGMKTKTDKKGFEVVFSGETIPLFRNKPDAFYSHQQWIKLQDMLLSMLMATTYHQMSLPPTLRLFYWLDLFALRQCQKDFNLTSVISLVERIGCTVAEIDTDLAYCKRTFCVFEVYASFAGKAKFLAVTPIDSVGGGDFLSALKDSLEKRPVTSAKATTRDPEDKETIDNYIKKLPGGFGKLDKDVTTAIQGGIQGIEKFMKGEIDYAAGLGNMEELDATYGC
jgi:hypothetical protein